MISALRIVVIGSGIAGLTAARRLDELGHVVSVLDKGRRPGGRLATRILDGGALGDHGAQFFTVCSEPFRARVAGWLADGRFWSGVAALAVLMGIRGTPQPVGWRVWRPAWPRVWTSGSPFALSACGR